MARENPIWGEGKIADELSLKLGIKVSPRTVRKYLGMDHPRGRGSDQRWTTFVRNHAKAIVACDFFVSVTATFRIVYVFVAMEIGSRRILHCNVTDHPTAEWTTQQFREILAETHPYRFVLHDRDSIFAPALDLALKDFGIRALKTPVRAPQANAFCERLIGTIRRECLDFLIPMNERHLWMILKEFVRYYNWGRPHSSLGPGIPEPIQAEVPTSGHRHKLPSGHRVTKTAILGGLHHVIAWKRRPLSGGHIYCAAQGCLDQREADRLALFREPLPPRIKRRTTHSILLAESLYRLPTLFVTGDQLGPQLPPLGLPFSFRHATTMHRSLPAGQWCSSEAYNSATMLAGFGRHVKRQFTNKETAVSIEPT